MSAGNPAPGGLPCRRKRRREAYPVGQSAAIARGRLPPRATPGGPNRAPPAAEPRPSGECGKNPFSNCLKNPVSDYPRESHEIFSFDHSCFIGRARANLVPTRTSMVACERFVDRYFHQECVRLFMDPSAPRRRPNSL